MVSDYTLGRQLRVYRTARGLNQDQVARAIGLSRAWLSNVERGGGISPSVLPRLLGALGFDKPEELATRLLANEPDVDNRLLQAEIAQPGVPSPQAAADALRGLLADHESYRNVLTFHPSVLSATKAVIFDLEELAHQDGVGGDSPIAGVLEVANRLRNALVLARTAARLGHSAMVDVATATPPPITEKEEVENGDHQAE